MKKSDLKNLDGPVNIYLKNIKEEDVIEAFENSLKYAHDFISTIPLEKMGYRHQPGKWTVGQILIHLIDNEKSMGNMALRFARNENYEKPPSHQNNYTESLITNGKSIEDLLEEFTTARKNNLAMFKDFDDDILLRTGILNKMEFSVLLIGFLIVGHELHHLKIIQEKYL